MVVAKKISSVNIFSLILYTILSSLPLLLVNLVSDLPISISNWESKVNDILNLNFPEDNFYPPGPAILILPFSWLIPKYFMIIFIYYLLSVILYFFICLEIWLACVKYLPFVRRQNLSSIRPESVGEIDL